jgi:ubiquinone/menaquinone biosynthesis C-methylase UbiE
MTAPSRHREPRTLSYEEARRVYDRIGARQDSQAFYEDVATGELIAHGDFEHARSVFEFGCGTGRFAEKLLRERLPPDAAYRAADQSPEMVRLAGARLAAFGERAEAVLSDGTPPRAEPAGSFDRFVSCYVLDLLSESDIDAVLTEAYRMLVPGGLLCACSLSPGHGALSKAVIGVWSLVHRLSPKLVGGCRPIALVPLLDSKDWEIVHQRALAPFGIPSEAVVARRAG